MQPLKIVPVPVISILLTGCATLPRLPSEEQLSIHKIVDHVQCELALAWAALPPKSPIRNWDAGFTLDLKVRTDSGIALGADRAIELGAGLLPSVSLKAGGNATRSSTTNFNLPMGAITDDLVEACRTEPTPTETTSWRLQGSLGVGEWVARMAKIIDEQDDISALKGFSYGVEFVLKMEAGGNLAFSYVTSNASVGPSISNEETHRIVAAFAPVPPPKTTVVQVKTIRGRPVRVRRLVPQTGAPASNVDNLLQQQRLNLQLQDLQER
ncbi:hypothetical protein [Microvirga splendida]|uniref:Lipoprotein n=1 Tax=Microvirga splendida TaxID=2795727 RepID=A0ABS0XVN0_9HYPH|nr:hypothetical protein [Microvirga splendida]MBJ6124082.1 hypothetical protein [Microvirga splendida]